MVLSVKVDTSSLQSDVLSETYGVKYSEPALLPRTFSIDLSEVIAAPVNACGRRDNAGAEKSLVCHRQQWSYVLLFSVLPKHFVPNICAAGPRPSSAKSSSILRS